MKTPPRYIRRHANLFLQAMQLIRDGKYYRASLLVKATREKKLIQKIQQKIDAHVKRTSELKRLQKLQSNKYFGL